jgi:hypothetical protein
MYLGDGYIAANRRGVYRLTICLDAAYEGIIQEVAAAIRELNPTGRAGIQRFAHETRGRVCWVVGYSRVWPCLLPQHGVGPKHQRSIVLEPWQMRLVTTAPGPLLRGLIHSDGTRHLNRVRYRDRVYEYPRYNFTNYSADIREIFCDACDWLGISWRRMNEHNISVARREAVARLDEFVGPKR